MATDPVDVLIIGAGASGAALAWSLADTRMNILCMEQGDWMDPAQYPGHARRLGGAPARRLRASARTRAGGARTIPSTTASSPIPISNFNAVGGSTILYAAHFPRFHPVGLPGADAGRRRRRLADRLPALEPYYDVNARMMGVSGLAGDPAYPPKEVPLPPVALGKLGETLARGLQQARLALVAVRQRDHDAEYEGRAPCINAGTCLLGCAQGAKASTDITYWPRRAAPGRDAADALPRARDHRRRRRHGRRRDLLRRRRRRATSRRRTSWCVACNGIGTPRLLLNSRSKHFPDGLANRSGLVGKNLMFHPYAMVTGIFDEPLEGYKGPTGCCIMSQEFYETDRVARLRARLLVRDPARLRPGRRPRCGACRRDACPRGADHHRAYRASCSTAPRAWWRSARTCPSTSNRVTLDPDARPTPTASRRRRSPIA